MKTLKKKCKSGFTLLEIIVCLVIIGLASSLVGIKGASLLAHHRFQTSTSFFLQELQRWRMLSLAYGCDVSCFIKKEGQGYKVSWIPDFIEEKAGIIPSYLTLEETKDLVFEHKSFSSFQFTLYSSGWISNRGVFSFIPQQEEKAASIDLSYPIAIKKGLVKSKTDLTPPFYPIHELEKSSF